MKKEIACPCPTGEVVLQTGSLPFSEIPGQTKLFLDYQTHPLELAKYYPLTVESHTLISQRIPDVLENYKTDRQTLCDILEETNKRAGAGEKTFENIETLREKDSVAVVTGQQSGLFTGPLYTIYKALSAVKMSECLKTRGFKAVPVFWAATEDHDFAEVSKIEIIDSNGNLAEIKNAPAEFAENSPVGFIELDKSIESTINELFENFSHTEFTAELREFIEKSYIRGVSYGDAFARLLQKFLGKYGLIVLDPLDARLKELAAPVYAEAIKKSGELNSALLKRSEELKQSGYHAQV